MKNVYKEKNKWRMNFLILRKAVPILVGMGGLIYVVFPLSFLPDLIAGEIKDACSKCISMMHGLLLIGCLLPCLALIPAWMEENSRELLYAISLTQTPCLMELLWILRLYTIVIAAPVMAACFLLDLSLIELLRMMMELVLVIGLYYLLTMILRSAVLGAMVLMILILLFLLVCRDDALQAICLIRPDLVYYDGFFMHEGAFLLPVAMISWGLALYIEKKKNGINI